MWSYVKNILLGFVYLLLADMVAFAVSFLDSPVAEFVVYLINAGFFCFVMWFNMYKEGEAAMNVRYSNDLEREYMVRTGFIRPLKTHEEYKPWKGFVMGLFVCAPLILCMIIHLILGLTAGTNYNGGGMVAGIIYVAFYLLFAVFAIKGSGETAVMPWGGYFALLYVVAVVLVVMGVSYILGGRKAVKQREMIEERHKEIYGE